MTEEQKRYLKAVLVGSTAAAALAAVARSNKAKLDRKKTMDVGTGRNAIVVHIKKKRFMKGLPTPEELAESRGEALAAPADQPEQIAATASEAPAPAEHKELPDIGGMSQKDLAAMKRDLLRSRGRGVDFFRKAASESGEGDPAPAQKGKADSSDKEGGKKEKDREERVLFRDQEGKFVSPTDPVAVAQAQAEKSAEITGFGDLIFHPLDSAATMWNAAKGAPVMATASILGSIWIAAKIGDAINKQRRKKSEEMLETARQEYVDKMQDEKVAQANGQGTDVRDVAGKVMGSAFVVPMALAAIVTNKIIENRKIDKKKKKEMEDSYPDDPVVLYKTSEDKTIEISPESAIALIAVQRGMCLDDGMHKAAQWGLPAALIPGIQGISGIRGKNMSADDYVKDIEGLLVDPDNDDTLMGLMRAYSGVDNNGRPDNARAMSLMKNLIMSKRRGRLVDYYNLQRNAELQNNVMGGLRRSAKLQEAMLNRMNSPAYAKKYSKLQNDIYDQELGKYFKKGGWLHTIISWIFRNLGLGKYFLNKGINSRFDAEREQYENSLKANPSDKPAYSEADAQGAGKSAPADAKGANVAGTDSEAPPAPADTPKPATVPAAAATTQQGPMAADTGNPKGSTTFSALARPWIRMFGSRAAKPSKRP